MLFIYLFFYYTYSFRYDINMTSRHKILFVQRKERIAIESFSNWNGIDCQDWHSIFDVSIWFRHFDVIPLWYHIVEIDRLIELSVKSSIFGKIYYSDHFPFPTTITIIFIYLITYQLFKFTRKILNFANKHIANFRFQLIFTKKKKLCTTLIKKNDHLLTGDTKSTEKNARSSHFAEPMWIPLVSLTSSNRKQRYMKWKGEGLWPCWSKASESASSRV